MEELNTENSIKQPTLPWPKIFLGVALAATIAGGLFATKILSGIEKNIAAAKEAARPADVKLTKIISATCIGCFNLEDAVAVFKKQNISIGEEKTIQFDSSEGQSLIKQFGIKRVPTYIVTGEVDKTSLASFTKANGEIKENTFIFTAVSPIFVDPETKKEMGNVVATLLTDPLCLQCIDPNLTVEALKKAGIKISDIKKVFWNSGEGQRIINQYKIIKVPTFLLSSDVDLYDTVKANWTNLGTIEQDKTYVARNLSLPYRDLDKRRIVGLIDLIYLTDSTCKDCYKPEQVQKQILIRGYGVGFLSERTVDINSGEGQKLKSSYKITKIPTVLLSPEADQYVGLKNVWKGVGTIEPSGWYIFREMQQLGGIIYKDLTSNQVIRPVQQPTGGTPSNQ